MCPVPTDEEWAEFEKAFDEAVEESAREAKEKFVSRVTSISRLTEEEIDDLFPDQADKKKLAKLMSIVKSAEDDNRKIVRLEGNLRELGDTLFTLLNKFV